VHQQHRTTGGRADLVTDEPDALRAAELDGAQGEGGWGCGGGARIVAP
jgi:hypothetical protein